MLVHEILNPQSAVDADYIAEQVVLELFGGLGGIASAGMGKLKQAGQAVKTAYNSGEIQSLLKQLETYKDQLKNVIRQNPQAFAGAAQRMVQPEVMTARPAAVPGQPSARDQYYQDRREQRGQRLPGERPLANLAQAEQRAGVPRPARRRVSGMQNAGMVPNAEAPSTAVPPRGRKPHIRMRAPRMEGMELNDAIITELFGGLGGIAKMAGGAVMNAGRAVGRSYAKGEAAAIIKKMMGIIDALNERGYQLPPELAREVASLQGAAA